MSKSLVLNYVHLIFATKYRKPVLDASWRSELFSAISEISNAYSCPTIAVGGYSDHVHILANLSKNIAAAIYTKHLKIASSQWISGNKTKPNQFRWQSGYGLFSVSHSQIPRVEAYIHNQEAHHSKRSFKQEIDEYARVHGVVWHFDDDEEPDTDSDGIE